MRFLHQIVSSSLIPRTEPAGSVSRSAIKETLSEAKPERVSETVLAVPVMTSSLRAEVVFALRAPTKSLLFGQVAFAL